MLLFRTKKNAQMEAMGLVIIAILLALGLLFVLFTIMSPNENPRDEFINRQLASNYINALIDTSVQECKGYSVAELLQDCFTFKEYDCPQTTSCDAAKGVIDQTLDSTLKKWNKNYRLHITRDGTNDQILRENININSESRRAEQFELPTKLGKMVKIKLYIYG